MRNYSSDKDRSKLFNEFCKLSEKRQKHMFAAIYGHMEDLERKLPEYISSGFFQGVESIINKYNKIDLISK